MSEWVQITSEIVIAFSTSLVVILAIWGNWVRAKLVPLKLSIEPHNLRDTVTRFTVGARVVYYHLKVVNHKRWVCAKNCRILLQAVYRKGLNGEFERAPLAVPLQFVWAPAEISPALISIRDEQVLDFGCVRENGKFFKPVLYWYPNDFDGLVRRDEGVRYCLSVVADGFASKDYKVFEVAWDGKWSGDLEEMSEYLTIREITEVQ